MRNNHGTNPQKDPMRGRCVRPIVFMSLMIRLTLDTTPTVIVGGSSINYHARNRWTPSCAIAQLARLNTVTSIPADIKYGASLTHVQLRHSNGLPFSTKRTSTSPTATTIWNGMTQLQSRSNTSFPARFDAAFVIRP
jgi:hypothetical protein